LHRSVIIDELKKSDSIDKIPIAFYYFDYRDKDCQTPNNVFSSILRQLVSALPEIPKRVIEAHKKSLNSSISELDKMLLEVIRNCDLVFIVVDALDECEEPRFRREFLLFLERLKDIKTARILVTSRPHVSDIKEILCDYPQIKSIQADDHDLRLYIRHEFDYACLRNIVDTDSINDIVEILVTKAQGM